jgi:polysaccharide export outer membrane protein
MSKRLLFQFESLLVFMLSACGAAPINYDYSREPDPRKTEYVIGVSDRLAVKVWKNPDLSTEAIVRPDGTVTLPLLGDLRAAGRTPTALRADIQKLLGNYIRDESAVVTVAITAVLSYSFTVSGNVEHPGVFTSEKYVTIVDAVQLAGGLNRYASPEQTQILRPGKDGKMRVIPIDFPAVQAGKQPEANIALIAGDRVFVP